MQGSSKTFLAQLSESELVQWDALLEQGVAEVHAQAILRPGFEPYVAVLAAADRKYPQDNPWSELKGAIDELELHIPVDGRTKSGVRITKGIGIDAPLCGALLVLSAWEGLTQLHELAVWAAYRRGCRRFLVLVTRSEQLDDDELAAYVASDAADSIRQWLGDVDVSHDWGSGRLASRKVDTPAGEPFARRVWAVIQRWHADPDHWKQRALPVQAGGQLLDVLEGLAGLLEPVCGLMGKPHHRYVDTEEWCSFHDEPRSEYFELDFTAPGHGLPFSGSWVLRSCSQLWERGRREYLWQDDTCWRIDRTPREVTQDGKPYVAGAMLPSLELLRNGERKNEIAEIVQRLETWWADPQPGGEQLYWEIEDLLELAHPPGYSQLGGTVTAPTSDCAIRCRVCATWMHFVFNGGEWGDYGMYLWVCGQCSDQAYLGFQK